MTTMTTMDLGWTVEQAGPWARGEGEEERWGRHWKERSWFGLRR